MTTAENERRVPVTDQSAVVVPGYALAFYRALVALAKKEAVTGRTGKLTVYRGGITKVFDELKISRAHYGRIVKTLEEIGAIEIIQRGNPRQETVVVFYGEPDLEALESAYYLTSPSERRKRSDSEVAPRVALIERRIGPDIDYVKALANLEGRIKALEKKVGTE